MKDYHRLRIAGNEESAEVDLPKQVQLAIDDLAGKMREGLLALSVGAGLKVMDELIEEELVRLCGPRGKLDPDRTASRHGGRSAKVCSAGARSEPAGQGPAAQMARRSRSAPGSCSHPRTCSTSARWR